ncbi:MAG: EFR1 family ferrodoxin [Proteobacteria bacterium]|nr:EFR1 family ferrodoxin [Pseudomonadota bacterium]
MKSLIICFSQTGHTRKVAECIQRGIAEAAGPCDLVELSAVDTASLADYDLVGLGCPVFYYKEPFNVRDFIESLPELPGKHWFFFCTHGAVLGNTFHSVKDRLNPKGIVVIGYHDTYADGVIPFYPYPVLTSGHPDAVDLEQAVAFGRDIASRRARIAAGEVDILPELEPASQEVVEHAQALSMEFMDGMFPRLSIDADRCIQCQTCEMACPVGGIDVLAEPPRLQSPCIYCWNCVKTCPESAIRADWSMMVEVAKVNFAMYRRLLDKAAAEGRFRWLVDPDSIDLEDPLYLQRERGDRK